MATHSPLNFSSAFDSILFVLFVDNRERIWETY